MPGGTTTDCDRIYIGECAGFCDGESTVAPGLWPGVSAGHSAIEVDLAHVTLALVEGRPERETVRPTTAKIGHAA
jgi:hypothetical protein